MWFLESLVIAILLTSSETLSTSGKELILHLCSNNETVTVQVLRKTEATGTTCQCQVGPAQNRAMEEDYTHTPGIGSHKLHTEANSWNEARKICNAEGSHLAIINSKAEEAILVDMLKKAERLITGGLNTEEAYLGIHDLYKEGEWVTIFGDSLYATGYVSWSSTYWSGQPDNFGGNQNCGAVLKFGGMDDVNCEDKFAFFCEKPLTC